jgi:hypothetical protein
MGIVGHSGDRPGGVAVAGGRGAARLDIGKQRQLDGPDEVVSG